MAVTAYNSPGVNVSETINPSVAPTSSAPALVAIVGAASGSQSASERVVLTGTTPVQLSNTGVTAGSAVVKLASTGATLNAGNYTITQTSDPDTTVVGDETSAITRVASPATGPTAAPSGTGTLTGTYEYAVSFTNANGETGIGPSSGTVVISGAGYNLSAIPVGPAGTTGRKIYRKKTVGALADSTFHLVATIADNATLVLTNETTADATANANAVPQTGILSGDTVIVNYSFTDQFYYDPTLFTDYTDVLTKYGPATDVNGAISSVLSYAVRLAFLNGASEVMAVAASADTQTPIELALSQLENEPDVNIVVIANGASWAAGSLYAHLIKMNQQGYYRTGVTGRDGAATLVPAVTTRAAATTFNEESLRYVNISSLWVLNQVTSQRLNLGAHFAAAAVAGMTAARDVQFPLTRKVLAGFQGINDNRTETEKAIDASNGLLVVEDRGGALRIRHDITTAIGSVNTREASVVRAKYDLAQRVRDALDTSVVGMVVPTTVGPSLVEAVVSGVLNSIVSEGGIDSFRDVNARLLSGDPTTIEVRFSYLPSYPINYINVIFTINTTSGDTNLTTT